ncbi:unnamed protein product [Tetraodon nigroviridis]|uniref:(spotted green pufferfish) hypothetical protein n=1 Tax=Tetraodon nigroviridis TaxID=99883 RepID=Q4SS82_TETNG|nr:unnamed protein product [Tetraodon nigroviridis]
MSQIQKLPQQPRPAVVNKRALYLCLCFGMVMFCQRERKRDGKIQWSSPLGQEEQPRTLEPAGSDLPVQVCGHQHELQEPEERGP